MPDDPKAKSGPRRLRPTIIEPPVRRAKRQDDAAPVPPHRPLTPTAIPGVERKRIAVGVADMTRLSPGAEPRTAALAVRMVDGFVVDDAREHRVAAWGQDAQQRGDDLAFDAAERARVDILGPAQGHVGRIAELLAAIDVEAPHGRSRTVLAELDQLVRLSQSALPSLSDHRTALEDHARRIDEAGLAIEAAALAATFLAEHLATAQPDLSRLFLQREISLTKTAMQIRGGHFERRAQVEDARTLVAAIQDVVLASLPDWLASLRAAPRRLTPTEAGDLRHRLRAILRTLEP